MSDEVEISIPEMHMQLAKQTAIIANQKMRDFFLSDEMLSQEGMRKLSPTVIHEMRRKWNPLEPIRRTGNKIKMRMKPSDIVWTITSQHYQDIKMIVTEAAMEAIMENPSDFVTAIINDAISEDPKLKYNG